ncbi:MAG: hypothetical protein AAF682_17345 [Planctomycetota bacterium]
MDDPFPTRAARTAVLKRLTSLERRRSELSSDVASIALLIDRERRRGEEDSASEDERAESEVHRRLLESRLGELEEDIESILEEARAVAEHPERVTELPTSPRRKATLLTLRAAAVALECTEEEITARIRSGEMRATRGLGPDGELAVMVQRAVVEEEQERLAAPTPSARPAATRRGRGLAAAAILVVMIGGALGALAWMDRI